MDIDLNKTAKGLRQPTQCVKKYIIKHVQTNVQTNVWSLKQVFTFFELTKKKALTI